MKNNLKKDTSWDHQAQWYDKIVGENGSYYHKNVIVPKVLELIGNINNKKILDLGCGQGFFTRILKSKGAEVVGVDLSKNLIETARKYPESKNITYYIANAENLYFLEKESFDYVISILSIGNIRNTDKVFKEIYFILKQKGKFIFVIIHPCFRIPRQSQWEYDESKKIQYRRIDRYGTELEIPIITHPGKVKNKDITDQDYTIMFHRPLSNLCKHLFENKFYISYLDELYSDKISYGKHAKSENRARKEFPLFLLVEAIKI